MYRSKQRLKKNVSSMIKKKCNERIIKCFQWAKEEKLKKKEEKKTE